MQIFLVGGAVRDKLLNLAVNDKDWVVVGAKPQDLITQGFTQVGKDFPVFLHPKTKDEYALARTERKSGRGYTEFICDFNENITLEQDLQRRDLTINAIAEDEKHNLIDPYGGVNDINQRILRHVSLAFKEDPLRVLRVARFAARFHHLGFTIAPETLELMNQIVAAGEIDHLTAERVWQETQKALATPNPQVFFEVLRHCQALAKLFPELDNLFDILPPKSCHVEINLGINTLDALKQSALITTNLEVRFAVLCFNFGNTSILPEKLSQSDDYSEKGIALINQLSARLKIPSHYKKIACLTCRYHHQINNITQLSGQLIITLLNGIDVWRSPDNLQKLLLSSLAIFQNQPSFANKTYPQAEYLKQAYSIANAVLVQNIIEAGFKGCAIQDELTRQRINAIDEWKNTQI